MKKDIGLFAMDRHIRGATLGDRIGWGGDILVVSVFLAGLRWIGLDGGIFSQIGIGNGDLGVFDRFHKVGIHIFNLYIFLCCGIVHCSAGALLARFGFLVGFDFALSLAFTGFVQLAVSFPLVCIEVLNEGLDVRDFVLPCRENR